MSRHLCCARASTILGALAFALVLGGARATVAQPTAEEGPWRAGVQTRVEAVGGNGSYLNEGVHLEIGTFADVRLDSSAFHLRLVLVLGLPLWFTGQSRRLSASHWFRVRFLPLAVDFAEWITLRIGGDVGVQWLPARPGEGDGFFEWMPAISGELVLRAVDGDVEVGLFGGMQFTGRNALASRFFYPIEQYVFGAQAAVLF